MTTPLYGVEHEVPVGVTAVREVVLFRPLDPTVVVADLDDRGPAAGQGSVAARR